jgi:hypothetical protein
MNYGSFLFNWIAAYYEIFLSSFLLVSNIFDWNLVLKQFAVRFRHSLQAAL